MVRYANYKEFDDVKWEFTDILAEIDMMARASAHKDVYERTVELTTRLREIYEKEYEKNRRLLDKGRKLPGGYLVVKS